MKIIATGATSFVGAGAVRELLARGHQVTAVVRPDSRKTGLLLPGGERPEGLFLLECDLGDLERLPELLGTGWDVFLHMGWKGAGSDSRASLAVQEENRRDSLKALEAAKQLGCRRFLFTGSQAEYGVHSCLIDEETECRPTSPYGEAKLAVCREAGKRCEELSMDYGHARIFSVYGPGDHPWSLLSSCVRTFLEGGVMEMGDCTQLWNFLYIDDAARAIALLCEYEGKLSAWGSVYNLGGSMEETGPLKGFVETVYQMCGSRGSCVYGVRKPNAEGVVHLNPDIRKMERILGWKPQVAFQTGMEQVLSAAEGEKQHS